MKTMTIPIWGRLNGFTTCHDSVHHGTKSPPHDLVQIQGATQIVADTSLAEKDDAAHLKLVQRKMVASQRIYMPRCCFLLQNLKNHVKDHQNPYNSLIHKCLKCSKQSPGNCQFHLRFLAPKAHGLKVTIKDFDGFCWFLFARNHDNFNCSNLRSRAIDALDSSMSITCRFIRTPLLRVETLTSVCGSMFIMLMTIYPS